MLDTFSTLSAISQGLGNSFTFLPSPLVAVITSALVVVFGWFFINILIKVIDVLFK